MTAYFPLRRVSIGSTLLAFAAVACFAAVRPAAGQGAAESFARPLAGTNVTVETKGDKFEYNKKEGILTLVGNGIVKRSDIREELHADYIQVNQKTGIAIAQGHVKVVRDGQIVLQSDELRYDINSGLPPSTTKPFLYHEDPFTLLGSGFEPISKNEFVLRDVTATTCDMSEDPYPPYKVKASKMYVRSGERLTGYNSTIWMGRVPVFYTPYWSKNLDEDNGWHLTPGYGSRVGAYMLAAYRARWNDVLRTETHIDYRTERGPAIGQDIGWKDPEGLWGGTFKSYYLNDDDPWDDNEDPDTSLVEEERYRFLFTHDALLTPKDYFVVNANYLSDPDVLEDFFNKEYRRSPEPENYASLTHRERGYSANLLLQPRLNDFYEMTERLPEASVSIPRVEIPQTLLYYEGRSSAAFLQRVFPEDSEDEDYSTLRVDSDNTVYYPTKHFGFLNVIPRAGYRATYYGDTLETITETEFVTTTNTSVVVDANGQTSTVVTVSDPEERSLTRRIEKGAQLRSLVEFGVESSFKAFHTFETLPGERPLRHVVEPRVNYTLIPEPNLTEDELLQFDSVDQLGEQHEIGFGVRNKLQTKSNKSAFDLVNVDLSTAYLIYDQETGNDFGPLRLDGELRPSSTLQVDFDGEYLMEDSTLNTFNTRVGVQTDPMWRTAVEHRYRDQDSSLLSGEVTMTPNKEWEFTVYARNEFETSELEEIAIDVQRTMACLIWKIGVGYLPGYTRDDGSIRDDEWNVGLELGLTAFPARGGVGGHSTHGRSLEE